MFHAAGVKRRAPALLVVPRELQIVTLMRHTTLDRSDARPGVQPAAQRLDLHGAPVRLPMEAREGQRSQQQASTRIEHWRVYHRPAGPARGQDEAGVELIEDRY